MTIISKAVLEDISGQVTVAGALEARPEQPQLSRFQITLVRRDKAMDQQPS